MTEAKKIDLVALLAEIGPVLAEHSARHDREGTFVEEAYAALRGGGAFSALVPTSLGGGGASMAEICTFIKDCAKHCPHTALALSMHTHLVAATVWKHKMGKGGEPLLSRVAKEELVLLSTGATDWVDSNGEMTKVDGGYRFNARKVFGSGGPGANVMITSGRYQDPERGARVLHFPVPMTADGVSSLGDWDTLGMRGTGSNTLKLDNVFVPDSAIALDRASGEWHPVWNAVLTVAVPIYMAAYVGIAEAAAEVTREVVKNKRDAHIESLVGQVENSLVAAQLPWRSMVESAGDLAFAPVLEKSNGALIRKTLCVNAAKDTVAKAMIASGGRAFYRKLPLERLSRDVQAAHFHPLPEHRQLPFSGRVALGRDPVTGASAET